MTSTTFKPKPKFELSSHMAGVAVDGFAAQTESLERFSEELTAALQVLEEKFEEFQTRSSFKKSVRG
jgi:hypothetical protein